MIFKKINDGKLKIILTNGELPSSTNLDDFMTDSSFARESFLDMLNEAYDEVGFNTYNYKIKIHAQELYDGNFVFIVTKLLKLKDGKAVVTPRKVYKETKSNYNFGIYQFDCFDDFCSFSKYLKSTNIDNLTQFCSNCQLYRYNDLYFLCFYINEDNTNIASFYSSITEFSKFVSNKPLLLSNFKEHGELVMDDNALITCQKYFK